MLLLDMPRRKAGSLRRRPRLLAAALLLALAVGVPASAHEGHDHGEKPAAAGTVPSSPRVVATSEAYQFVGIVEGEVLVVYLDRAADNAPVTAAKIEVSLNGQTFKADPQKKGTFEITAPLLRKPGQIEVLATVLEGGVSDLLAGALTIPDPALVSAGASQDGVMGWINRAFASTQAARVAATEGTAAATKTGGTASGRGYVVPFLLLAAGLLIGIGLGHWGLGRRGLGDGAECWSWLPVQPGHC